MISFAGKKILVQGLGNFGGGVGVARWLAAQGAHVTITDMASAEKLAASIKALDGVPVEFKLGGHDIADFTSCDLLVVNPAVDRATSPHVQAAIAAGIPITTEINLFVERCRGLTIGITGSIGKSTTTALIYHALLAGLTETGTQLVSAADPMESPTVGNDANKLAASPFHSRQVFLGGNIGKSLLLELEQIRPQDLVVLELSSFMLEDIPRSRWSPNIAVVTNLVPNHLDRHGSMEAYGAAKRHILSYQQPGDIAILNSDNAEVAQWGRLAKGQVAHSTMRGMPSLPLAMPGAHNQSNARAALAVLDALPFAVDRAAALAAIVGFRGLEHRLQWVHTSWHTNAKGSRIQVRWFNDSKATSPEASITALRAFPPGEGVIACIVGGYDKHVDMSEFVNAVVGRATWVLGIGQTGQALVDAIRQAEPDPEMAPEVQYVETLERAVAQAVKWVETFPCGVHPYVVVLLSTASASWGQFQNYEERGDRFTQLAQKSAK